MPSFQSSGEGAVCVADLLLALDCAVGVEEEDVGGAVIRAAVVIVVGPDKRRVAGDGDRHTEAVVRGAVRGGEFGLKCPHTSIAREDVRRAGVVAVVIVAKRADQGVVTRQRDAAGSDLVPSSAELMEREAAR